jgi:hypothetical protein
MWLESRGARVLICGRTGGEALSHPRLATDTAQRQGQDPQALTFGSGPQSLLSRASFLGRNCAQECHLHQSGPPPAGPPGLGTMENRSEEGQFCPSRYHCLFCNPTWPLTSGKAHPAPSPDLLAQALSKLATGQEGLPTSELWHSSCPLLTGACHR